MDRAPGRDRRSPDGNPPNWLARWTTDGPFRDGRPRRGVAVRLRPAIVGGLSVDVVADISENEWDAFLTHNPDGTIFQSPAMSHVYRGTRGYRPHVVAALSGGRLTAVPSAATGSYSPSRTPPLTSPAIVPGGPGAGPAGSSAPLRRHHRVPGVT